jgi:hypothetical protein
MQRAVGATARLIEARLATSLGQHAVAPALSTASSWACQRALSTARLGRDSGSTAAALASTFGSSAAAARRALSSSVPARAAVPVDPHTHEPTSPAGEQGDGARTLGPNGNSSFHLTGRAAYLDLQVRGRSRRVAATNCRAACLAVIVVVQQAYIRIRGRSLAPTVS